MEKELRKFWNEVDGSIPHLGISSMLDNIERWRKYFLDKVNFKDRVVLDYGIGGGYMGMLLHAVYGIKKYVGVDISERQLGVAEKLLKGTNSEFHLAPYSFKDAKPDIIISNAVIQHFVTESMLKEFMENVDESNCDYALLKIRYGKETKFSGKVDIKEDVVYGCYTNADHLEKYLVNYSALYASEWLFPNGYQFLIYKRLTAKSGPRVYVFDLDETVCGPGSYEKAQPIPGMVELVRDLYNSGQTIYFHTGRHMLHDRVTRGWLNENHVPYHNIFYGKPVGDYYIDDKAVRFDGDVDALRERLKR